MRHLPQACLAPFWMPRPSVACDSSQEERCSLKASFPTRTTLHRPHRRSPASVGTGTRRLIERLVEECPERYATSKDERRAQDILAGELARHGGQVEYLPFRFNISLYAVIALHFGLAALAGPLRLVHPAIALALHLLVLISYVGDSAKWFRLLRRLCPYRPARNLIVTYPARGPMRRRIVLLGHADAAFTGWLFEGPLARAGGEYRYWWPIAFLRKPMRIAAIVLALVCWQDFSAMTIEFFFWWNPAGYVVGHVYFFVIFLLNLQIVLRHQVVAGANDNLTGCAALVTLARQFAVHKPEDVELVLGVTACEEAGTGGAIALAHQMRHRWDRSDTMVVALECLGRGELRILQEGEIVPARVTPWLLQAAYRAAEQDPRYRHLSIYNIPAGGTDALPFLVHGYPSICIGCIDPDTGLPANYHQPDDRPENLDDQQLADAIDFVERFVRLVSQSAGASLPLSDRTHGRLMRPRSRYVADAA